MRQLIVRLIIWWIRRETRTVIVAKIVRFAGQELQRRANEAIQNEEQKP